MSIFDDPVLGTPTTPWIEGDKIFNDPVHGHINFSGHVLSYIDTPEFQRLRDLKQLGSAYYVFPGASHNRFEHSLGVGHLAGQLIDRFRRTQPELELSLSDAACVELAGLCHDLGHGPFSHVFDAEFIPRALGAGRVSWEHEDASCMMLDRMAANGYLGIPEDSGSELVEISKSQLEFIKDLIKGKPERATARPSYVYEVVANKRTNIDVDKFDYLVRDCLNTGMKSSYDISRLMTYCRVIDDEICYHSKEQFNLYELFHTRYSLFKQVYTHKAGKAIEYMVVDALLEADPVLKFSEAIYDPDEYFRLTDSVLKSIEVSKDPRLEKSQKIIQRIRRRDLYRFVDECIVPRGIDARLLEANGFPAITEETIAECNPVSSPTQLDFDDIVLQRLTLSYGMKERNPIDKVRFFSRYDSTTAYAIPRHRVPYLVPQHFQEKCLRLFVKDGSDDKMKAAQSAFRACIKEHLVRKLDVKGGVDDLMNPALVIPESYSSQSQMTRLSNSTPRKKKRRLDSTQ